MATPCPLCSSSQTRFYVEAHRRAYLECDVCGLIFLSPDQRLDPAAEQAHYLTHQNNPDDPRYRDFLDRLARPLEEHLKPGAQGLDLGAGPGPTLSLMLEERGFPTRIYDPYFAPDVSVFESTYDFITATEVIEHFHHPGDEFQRLNTLLKPSGWLAIMTEMVRDDRPFSQWHYPRDPTHVSFYRQRSLEWIAKSFGYTLEVPRQNVVLFQKNPF